MFHLLLATLLLTERRRHLLSTSDSTRLSDSLRFLFASRTFSFCFSRSLPNENNYWRLDRIYSITREASTSFHANEQIIPVIGEDIFHRGPSSCCDRKPLDVEALPSIFISFFVHTHRISLIQHLDVAGWGQGLSTKCFLLIMFTSEAFQYFIAKVRPTEWHRRSE